MSKLTDENSSRQLQRMIDSIENFTDAFTSLQHAWTDLQKNCRMLLEMELRSEYHELRTFLQYGRGNPESTWPTGYFKDLANSLEKELIIVKKTLK